jgi:hypothetical protein
MNHNFFPLNIKLTSVEKYDHGTIKLFFELFMQLYPSLKYKHYDFRLSQHHNLVGFTGFFLSCQVAHSLSMASTGFYSLINKMANASAEV